MAVAKPLAAAAGDDGAEGGEAADACGERGLACRLARRASRPLQRGATVPRWVLGAVCCVLGRLPADDPPAAAVAGTLWSGPVAGVCGCGGGVAAAAMAVDCSSGGVLVTPPVAMGGTSEAAAALVSGVEAGCGLGRKVAVMCVGWCGASEGRGLAALRGAWSRLQRWDCGD